MQTRPIYGPRERFWLRVLAVVALVGVNGAFVYGAVIRPELLRAALANPVALAFMAEALILVGVLAYLFRKWGVSRIGWGWFVLLSFLGSLAFAVPVALLFPRSGSEPE